MERNELFDVSTKFMEQVYGLQKRCQEILRDCYGNQAIALPVDIGKVADELGVKLVSEDLNYGSEDGIDLNIASLLYEEDDGDAVIQVDISTENSEDTLNPYSDLQKYAIAYELGKIIINGHINDKKASKMPKDTAKKWNMISTPYSLPRLYAQWDSFAYEMCAIFLLLPLDLFLEEFLSYIRAAKDHPVIMDKWIKHLSDKAGIPNYQLVNGYQYIKFCAYQYYQEKYKVSTADKIEGTDYRELYR